MTSLQDSFPPMIEGPAGCVVDLIQPASRVAADEIATSSRAGEFKDYHFCLNLSGLKASEVFFWG
jgi:hypothetical protein